MTRKIDIDVAAHTKHHLSVEWEWQNVEGVVVSSPADGPPPRLVVTITQLDPCSADPPPDVTDRSTG